MSTATYEAPLRLVPPPDQLQFALLLSCSAKPVVSSTRLSQRHELHAP